MTITHNYTAANSFPVKVLHCTAARTLTPTHIQWIPTNVCNLTCSFCCCRHCDRKQEMDIETALTVLHSFIDYGIQAVTISGGGEPLCHPHLSDMIRECHQYGIKIGMATNGVWLDRLDADVLEMLTWCRISHSDYRTLTPNYRAMLHKVTEVPIDWAFSYVINHTPNLDEIANVVDFANEHKFTHVRLAINRLENNHVEYSAIRSLLRGRDDIVIYQDNVYAPESECLLGYIKPSVCADFRMYLCCGVQYAIKGKYGYFPDELCMGSALNLDAIYGVSRRAFSVCCDRCYYVTYNQILKAMQETPRHLEFV